VLVQLEDPADRCGAHPGLGDVPKEILDVFLDEQRKQGGDVSRPVCVLDQLHAPSTAKAYAPGETCKDRAELGWCYVENDATRRPARKCSQAIAFSAAAREIPGARFTLQCINNLAAGP
jgi:hypothetical protein